VLPCTLINFESAWKKKYADRGIRKILAKYSEEAGLLQNLSPHKLWRFLLTGLKKQGIADALIQPVVTVPVETGAEYLYIVR